MGDLPSVLVVGASGQIGRRVCRGLLDRGVEVRALTHSDAGAERLAQLGVRDVVRGDLSDVDTLPPCFAGVDRVMLVTRAFQEPAQEIHAVEATRAAGVSRIVKLSSDVLYEVWDDLDDGGRAAPGNMVAALHGPAEDRVRASGLEHVLLRSTWFMSIDASPVVAPGLAEGQFVWPVAAAGLALVDPGDVADVAVQCLLADDVGDPVLRVTGPEELSPRDIAAGLSALRGAPVVARSLPLDDYTEWIETVARMPRHAASTVTPYATRRSAVVSGVVEKLLERPARTFAQYVADERAQRR